jgi:hypothetical protein
VIGEEIPEEFFEEITWYWDTFNEPTIEVQISQALIDKSNPKLTREIDVEVDSMFDKIQERS